jgi:hypothetical protein
MSMSTIMAEAPWRMRGVPGPGVAAGVDRSALLAAPRRLVDA